MSQENAESLSTASNPLIAALIKAKQEFLPIRKDASNPFFKSKYATLDHIMDCVSPALANNGLLLTQTVMGNTLVTTVFHTSGKSLCSEYPLPEMSDPQKFGSSITYARRYALSALLTLSTDEDDDGNVASQKQQTKATIVEEAPVAKSAFAPKRKPVF